MVITLGKKDNEIWHLPFSQVPPVFGEPYSAAVDASLDDFVMPLSFFKDRPFIIDALTELMPYFAGNTRPYIHPSSGDIYLLSDGGISAMVADGKIQMETTGSPTCQIQFGDHSGVPEYREHPKAAREAVF